MENSELSERIELQVRFSEVDAMRVVWHGHYLKYFEEGREAFGRKYGIGYFDVEAEDLLVPVVHADLDYKRSLRYGDRIVVHTRFVDSPAAKIIFQYTIRRLEDDVLVATGQTVQVFTNRNGELQLITPAFFQSWKAQWMGSEQ